MGTSFDVIIPARYGSTRLKAKPLQCIAGRPMVLHVADVALCSGADHVWVATDDERIQAVCEAEGVKTVMTDATHTTGTDRIAEAVSILALPEERIVINLQGDEPRMSSRLLRFVAEVLSSRPDSSMSTVVYPLKDPAVFVSPHVVKVVCDASMRALYFSRAPIPFPRDAHASGGMQIPEDMTVYAHVGLYAYRVQFLKKYASLAMAPMEVYERLEQLRVLYHGYVIAVGVSEACLAPGIDTAEDLVRLNTVV